MSIEERLARLERSHRLWRAVGVAATIGLVAAVIGTNIERAGSDELRARRLVIVDDDGGEVIALGVDDRGPVIEVVGGSEQRTRVRPQSISIAEPERHNHLLLRAGGLHAWHQSKTFGHHEVTLKADMIGAYLNLGDLLNRITLMSQGLHQSLRMEQAAAGDVSVGTVDEGQTFRAKITDAAGNVTFEGPK